MTIDDLAGRLGAAADKLDGMRAELDRQEREPALDAVGGGQREVFLDLAEAWGRQRELVVQLADEVRRMAADVTRAAENYRASDELLGGGPEGRR